VGHLIRCLALADELIARGCEVYVLGDVSGVALAEIELSRRGLRPLPGPATPQACVAAARELGLAAMVLDSYTLDPECAGALRVAGVRVLVIMDDDPRGQDADIYLDQNLGAEERSPDLPEGARYLAGVEFALLRRAVTARRPARPPAARTSGPTRVLCFFGGTDAFNAATILTPLVLATELPMDVTVVAVRPETVAAIDSLEPCPGQSVRVVAPTDELPELMTQADLVVSASGTSTWEILCLGVPAALVWVVENQLIGFDRVVGRGLAAGLGRLADLAAGGAAADRAVAILGAMISDPERRESYAAKAWMLVDGRGSQRVAGVLLTW
jgi:spore coat polysaccharide biosynthesis predicted glycosyltransferase SpsG